MSKLKARKLLSTSMFFSLVSFFIRPNILWAAEPGTHSGTNPGAKIFWLLIIGYASYTRRKNAVGGWLFFYFFQLYAGLIITVLLVIPSLSNFNPANWADNKVYVLFLLSTVPSYIMIIFQVLLSFKLMSKKREYKYIKALILVLIADIIFTLISIPIDLNYWPDSIYLTLYTLIWPLIWLPYFKLSKRISHVYKDKDWEQYKFLIYPVKLEAK